MPSSSPSPFVRVDSPAVRFTRSLLVVALVLILTLLLGLALLTHVPLLRAAVETLVTATAKAPLTAGWITLAFLALTPVLLLVVIRRLRLRSWWWITGGYLAVAPVPLYLVVDDDGILYPVTLEEISPPFPGAEKSYAVLMQYSNQHPSAEAKAFAAKKFRVTASQPNLNAPTEWIAYLEKNRADLAADWADLAPQRRWLEELNSFDRIGDLGAAAPSADIIKFQVWRLLAQRTSAQASLLALDGHGDEALATLAPMLHAARKLQPSSRTLVRTMIAIVVERMMIQTATFVLDHATVSPGARIKFAALLEGGVRGEAGARRLVGIEYSLHLSAFLHQRLGSLVFSVNGDRRAPVLRPVLNAGSAFVYNPVRTFNDMGRLTRGMQDLAAARQPIVDAKAHALLAPFVEPHFKNFFGSLFISMSTPAYSKVVESYWKLQDLRDALAARLGA